MLKGPTSDGQRPKTGRAELPAAFGISRHTARGQGGIHSCGRNPPFDLSGRIGGFIAAFVIAGTDAHEIAFLTFGPSA